MHRVQIPAALASMCQLWAELAICPVSAGIGCSLRKPNKNKNMNKQLRKWWMNHFFLSSFLNRYVKGGFLWVSIVLHKWSSAWGVVHFTKKSTFHNIKSTFDPVELNYKSDSMKHLTMKEKGSSSSQKSLFIFIDVWTSVFNPSPNRFFVGMIMSVTMKWCLHWLWQPNFQPLLHHFLIKLYFKWCVVFWGLCPAL